MTHDSGGKQNRRWVIVACVPFVLRQVAWRVLLPISSIHGQVAWELQNSACLRSIVRMQYSACATPREDFPIGFYLLYRYIPFGPTRRSAPS